MMTAGRLGAPGLGAGGLVCIKGAGDLATGVAYRLRRAGFAVMMTELPKPLCVRRAVALAEAVEAGRHEVEGMQAVRADTPEAVQVALAHGLVPVAVDPKARMAARLRPVAVVDAIMAKRNTGTRIDDAPVVVALGPGFTAGVDCHAVVETQRGHWLGRALYEGSAAPDTGSPGEVAGVRDERVLRASTAGVFYGRRAIADAVAAGEEVGVVKAADGGEAVPVITPVAGVVRGLIRDGVEVRRGLKVGDVDPTGEVARCHAISDKALAVGGGVLEAVLYCLRLREARTGAPPRGG